MITHFLSLLRTYNFWLSVVNLFLAAVVVTCTEIDEGPWAEMSLLSVNVMLLILVAAIPIEDQSQKDRLTLGLAIVGLIHACMLLLGFFSRYADTRVGLVGASLAASFPFAIFSYLFIRDKPVLWVPVCPYLLLSLAYLVTEIAPLGFELEQAAAALPIVMITFSA